MGARTAAGVLDAAMQKDLRASHFQLSHVKEPFPETCAKEGMRKAERAVEERRQKIANSEVRDPALKPALPSPRFSLPHTRAVVMGHVRCCIAAV